MKWLKLITKKLAGVTKDCDTNWIKFFDEHSLEIFEEAAYKLYKPLFVNLNKYEQLFFYNYWWKIFNTSECYVLKENKEIIAMVSYPKIQDVHYQTWQVNTLVVNENFNGELSLPKKFKKETWFTVPSMDCS